MAATKDIVITRIFNAPRELVWKAWTQPDMIKKWWGPKDFTCPAAKIDLKTGGKFLYCMRGPAGSPWDKDMWSGGEFLEVVPMEKIVATDNFTDEKGNVVNPKDVGMPGEWPEQMVVSFTFEDAGPGKTKLTLVHKGHPAEMASDATQGWSQSLDKFEAALA
jgi:uncharacterized protein YndB with AHSA1/START domain